MNWKQWVGALLALAIVVGTGWYVWTSISSTSPSVEMTDPDSGESLKSDSIARVVLNDTKRAVADIQTEQVRIGDLQLSRTLPGRFIYDETRHVALRAPTDGVLLSVMAQVGDSVDKGDAVAVLQSPTVGEARNQVLTAQTELELAETRLRWQQGIRDGVRDLIERIESEQSVEQIKASLDGQSTGDFGGRLLTAYSKSRLASNLSQSVGSIGDSGAISGRVVRERKSEQQQAAASLAALAGQSRYETEQATARAKANVNAAGRKLRIVQQELATLIGSNSLKSGGLDISPNDPDLSRLTIESSISGTVERRVFSATERVSARDQLFIIADTKQLWVEGDIRGRDWDSIGVQKDSIVQVTTPLVECPPQKATVVFVGRQFDTDSGTIPLVASIDNADGIFRPGLFARIAVPAEIRRNVLSVPESALIDLDGQDSVFIDDGESFIPVAVDVGSTSEGRVEILRGLKEGDAVVTSGAFLLKSELLLEGEE